MEGERASPVPNPPVAEAFEPYYDYRMIEAVQRKLADEVERLNHELNVTLPKALEKAIRNGDLRENGDYHAALERQQFVQARLNQLRERLGRLASLDPAKIPTDRVGLGSRVAVEDLDTGDRETYELVIPDAADFDGGQVSVSSPLGRALLDRKKGEKVNVQLPAMVRRLKLTKVQTAHDLVEQDVEG